ncbi:MAG: glutamine synthetase adenylyltransferase [Planctomycetaceae bacterium]
MFTADNCLALLNSAAEDGPSARRWLTEIGFSDAETALRRLRSLAQTSDERSALAAVLPALFAALSEAATPDGSLTNFERLTQASPQRDELYRYLGRHPRAIEILVRLFVGSQFLTEILLRSPHYLHRLVEHKRVAEVKSRPELYEEGRAAAAAAASYGEKLNALRRFQQWELLRLAACDAFGLMDLKTVTLQLALLADSLIQNTLAAAVDELQCDASDFAILAFGKLGGEELNYSSDIDLVFVCAADAERHWALGQRVIKALSEATADGFLYRVDMRLRPWGSSGPLVATVDAYESYLRQHGRIWEKQALLKARPVAGNLEIGATLLRRLEPIVSDVAPEAARAEIRDMKRRMEQQLDRSGRGWGEVKTGRGSIRDVEFVTQYLQLVHGRELPSVRSANTLDGLVRLADHDILQADEYRQLTGGYVVLRTIEHALQRMHNKQAHALPDDARELDYLAKRLDFPGGREFVQYYDQHRRAIRRIFERRVLQTEETPDAAPQTTRAAVATHLGDAANSYAELFNGDDVVRHLKLLEQLGAGQRVTTQPRRLPDGAWELTVVGYDQLGDLSLMCGLLLAHGWNIESGCVFTGADVETLDRVRLEEAVRRRKYVNVFRIQPVAAGDGIPDWDTYETELRELLRLAEEGRGAEAQGRLARQVAAAMPPQPATTGGALLPVEITIDNRVSDDATVMHIRADDTTGFLYELTSALAMRGVSIQRVWIASEGPQVVDTLWVVDAAGEKIEDVDRLNELRAAVVLIKHFTHLLPRSSNPEAALVNFREFVGGLFRRPGWMQDLADLQNSEVLDALARLLGVSDFLWHDCLRLQHANLFPVVADIAGLQQPKSRTTLAADLDRTLAACQSAEARRDALNDFKDRESLRIDMRHVLGLQDKFGMFSHELTDLAEVIVTAALRMCDAELRATYGTPLRGDGAVCGLSVCALGKCGGQELGFASDIELLFVYDADGDTSGPDLISNAEYFERLVEAFRKTIRAKREGIFEIDLRLRPYGKAGGTAISWQLSKST